MINVLLWIHDQQMVQQHDKIMAEDMMERPPAIAQTVMFGQKNMLFA